MPSFITDSLFERKMLLEAELQAINNQLNTSLENKSWKQKAIDCISYYKKYCTTVEILICVLGEKTYDELSDTEREKNISNLSVTLFNLKREGYINKVRVPGLKGNYYGLSTWFGKNGTLKTEYMNNTIRAISENNGKRISCCS